MLTIKTLSQSETINLLQSETQYFYPAEPIELESGETLFEPRIAYQTFGQLNADASNVVWVCHALTANANPLDWWPGLAGKNDLINPDQHFIICANVLGSCYGSTGPKDFNPLNGERYLRNFAQLTIRDMVHAHELLRHYLGIEKIYLGLGGSMGAQQVLEWAILHPEVFEHIALIASAAQSSPWGIAVRTAQRMAIEADPSFYSSSPKGGWKGLEAARAIAMLSYRTQQTYNEGQSESVDTKLSNYKAENYQRYQGLKLSKRFDAHTYYTLNKAMDTHHVGRNRGGIEKALGQVKAKTLVLGIEGDQLFTTEEQRTLAAHIPNAHLTFVPSRYGHDGFLLEAAKIGKLINNFLNKTQNETH